MITKEQAIRIIRKDFQSNEQDPELSPLQNFLIDSCNALQDHFGNISIDPEISVKDLEEIKIWLDAYIHVAKHDF